MTGEISDLFSSINLMDTKESQAQNPPNTLDQLNKNKVPISSVNGTVVTPEKQENFGHIILCLFLFFFFCVFFWLVIKGK